MNRLICLLCLFITLTAKAQPPSPRTDYLGDPLPAGALYRLGTTRLRHLGGCDFLHFTDDGKSLLAVGWSDWPSAWDVESGKQINTDMRQFELLDKATGKSVVARIHPALWSATGFGREGNTLLVVNYDRDITAWDLASGKATVKSAENLDDLAFHTRATPEAGPLRYLDPLTGQDKRVTTSWSVIWRNWSLADSVDPVHGRRLRLHHWSSGEEQKSETRQKSATAKGGVFDLLTTIDIPEKQLSVRASWDGVGVLNLANDEFVWQKEITPRGESGRGSKTVRNNCLALSPDGKMIAVGTDSGYIELMDLATGNRVGGSRFHPGFFSGPAQFVPGSLGKEPGDKYLVVPMGREAVLWDLAAGKKVRGWGDYSDEDLHLPSPARETLLVVQYAAENTHQVSLEETVSGKKLWTLPDRFKYSPVGQFSADGRFIKIEESYGTGKVLHVSAKTGKQLSAAEIKEAKFAEDEKSVKLRAGVKNRRAAVAPDRRLVAHFVLKEPPEDSYVEVRDVQTKEVLLQLEPGPRSRLLTMRGGPIGCISADNKIFAYHSGDSIVFYDLQTKQQLGPARPHVAPIWDMTFAPSGYLLAAYCNDSTIMVWDAKAAAR